MIGNETSKTIEWIGADWGTSNLRVWGFDADGVVLASASSSQGMGKLSPGDYEPQLLSLIDPWLNSASSEKIPVLVCGMAGARQGWREAAYRDLPCAPVSGEALTNVPVKTAAISVSIIPGLAQRDPPDVMRGEETQLAGLVALGLQDGVVCLPGTHSKWVKLENGAVTGFRTFMTGELFAVLREHSILRHSTAPATNGNGDDMFLAAVRASFNAPQDLTGALFSIRAANLVGESRIGSAGTEQLSGLLIGAELAATRHLSRGGQVHLAGDKKLGARYARALEELGAEFKFHDGEALTITGLRTVRSELGGTRK